MKEGMQRWLVSSFIIADELPVPGVREILRQHWILAGGQSTADRFDSPLSGLISLPHPSTARASPAQRQRESPQVLARAKSRFFRKSLLESGRMRQE